MAVYTALLHDQISVTCIICHAFGSVEQMTAGSLYANETQAFACTSHMFDRELWISAWALFDNEQEIVKLCRDL